MDTKTISDPSNRLLRRAPKLKSAETAAHACEDPAIPSRAFDLDAPEWYLNRELASGL